ncbi:hypothetical protein [Methanosarcina sp. UBA411]|uniref:hypothetical protein n=1 Tax=Methanosarcina sp. UBA411 TaxID=1915589 RepID=UPI0025D249C5|nr:hypothetical protein [Methanosarcina sp. UBA411]
MFKPTKHIFLILLSTCFILTAVLNLLVFKMHLLTYQFSIYENIPNFIWIFVIVNLLFGVFLTLACFLWEEIFNFWKAVILLIVLNNLIVILLPYLCGYYSPSSGDHLSHIGYTIRILQDGFIAPRDVYPATHILMGCISLIAHNSIYTISYFIGSIFYIFFLIFTYLFSRSILQQKVAVLSLLSGTVLSCYYFTYLFPMGFALLLLPLIFLLYFKHQEKKHYPATILLLMWIFSIVPFHPFASFIYIGIFMLLEFGSLFFAANLKNRDLIKNLYLYKNFSLSISIILFIVNMIWIWRFYWVWDSSVECLVSWANSELLVQSMASRASESFEKINFSLSDIITLFIKIYGQIFIYFLLSIAVSMKILKDKYSYGKHLFSYSLTFFIISLLWITDYIRPLTSLSSGRLIACVVPMFPLLVGTALYRLLSSKPISYTCAKIISLKSLNVNYLNYILVFLILSFCFIGEVLSYYPSSYIYKSNEAISYSNANGLEWVLENGISDNEIIGAGVPTISRIGDSIYGTHRIYPNWNGTINDHFGYSSDIDMLSNLLNGCYLITDRQYLLYLYNVLFPEIGRFNNSDFIRLNNDNSTSLIYTNQKIVIWYIPKKFSS